MSRKRFASGTQWGGGGAGASWGVKSRSLGGGRRKVAMAVPATTSVGVRYGGRGVLSGGGNFRRRRAYQGGRTRTGGFTGIERKFYDTSLIGAALTAPTDATGGEHDQSATICMNSITQGDGESQRDGRKCTVQSAYVKGVINCPAQANQTATDAASKIYIALVLDTQTNGAQLNSEDVFKNDGANAITAASPMRNMQFTQRFRILDTAELVMQNPNISWDGTNMEQQGLVSPFQLSSNIEFSSQYSGTTESVANITDNSLHIIAYCNENGLAPTISYNARVRFVG